MGINCFPRHQILRRSVNLVKGLNEFLFRYGHTVDLNSLQRRNKMRRRIKPGSVSGLVQHGCDHCAGGTFAVGAGHMHKALAAFRMTQRSQQRLHAFQAELGSCL